MVTHISGLLVMISATTEPITDCWAHSHLSTLRQARAERRYGVTTDDGYGDSVTYPVSVYTLSDRLN